MYVSAVFHFTVILHFLKMCNKDNGAAQNIRPLGLMCPFDPKTVSVCEGCLKMMGWPFGFVFTSSQL